MFRVIVAGSRGFEDYDYCSKILEKAFMNKKPDYIISGLARGADQIGLRWALEHGVRTYEFPANWEREGRSAGYNRNVRMAEVADAAVVFWDGESRGSKHMINIARDKGIPVIICKYKENKIQRIKGRGE